MGECVCVCMCMLEECSMSSYYHNTLYLAPKSALFFCLDAFKHPEALFRMRTSRYDVKSDRVMKIG